MIVDGPFWHLGRCDSTRTLAEWFNEETDFEQVICPVVQGHMRPGDRLTDLSIVLPGGEIEDFVWTWYSECLMQDQVLALFRSERFIGFDVKPVKAKFKRPRLDDPPRLWEMIASGSAGTAPPESGIRVVDHCTACGYKKYSACTNPEKLINESHWDGSDFFTVAPLRCIFVTDRVARAVRDNDLSGVIFRNPETVQFDG